MPYLCYTYAILMLKMLCISFIIMFLIGRNSKDCSNMLFYKRNFHLNNLSTRRPLPPLNGSYVLVNYTAPTFAPSGQQSPLIEQHPPVISQIQVTATSPNNSVKTKLFKYNTSDPPPI